MKKPKNYLKAASPLLLTLVLAPACSSKKKEMQRMTVPMSAAQIPQVMEMKPMPARASIKNMSCVDKMGQTMSDKRNMKKAMPEMKVSMDPMKACPTMVKKSRPMKKRKIASTMPKEWSYKGQSGPEFWHEMDEASMACNWGKRQSPINLMWTRPISKNPIQFDYKQAPSAITNTGNGFEVWFGEGNKVMNHGMEFELKRISFHTPSEHTLSGKHHSMEIQFEHWGKNGNRLMISVFARAGEPHEEVANIWQHLKGAGRTPASMPKMIDPEMLLPGPRTHYNYMGSITRPPCTENAEWVVFNNPIQVSREQLVELRNYYHKNIRPIQSTNRRAVSNH